MKYHRRTFLTTSGAALAAAASTRILSAARPTKNEGIVVGNSESVSVGAEILAAGGNAVDAIVAGALVAGVCAIPNCGIGGYGGHMTIGLPNGKVASIDFNSTAPAAARPDMFPIDENGNVKGNVHMTGWLAAGVPGTLAGLQLALDKYGTMPFDKVVKPAIRYARNGFPVHQSFGYWQESALPHLKRDPESIRLFTRNGRSLQRGDTFRNP